MSDAKTEGSQAESKPIPVLVPQEVCQVLHKNWCVVVAADHAFDRYQTATYGVDPADKVIAAKASELFMQAIGSDLTQAVMHEDFRQDLQAGSCKAALELLHDISHSLCVPTPMRDRAAVILTQAKAARREAEPNQKS